MSEAVPPASCYQPAPTLASRDLTSSADSEQTNGLGEHTTPQSNGNSGVPGAQEVWPPPPHAPAAAASRCRPSSCHACWPAGLHESPRKTGDYLNLGFPGCCHPGFRHTALLAAGPSLPQSFGLPCLSVGWAQSVGNRPHQDDRCVEFVLQLPAGGSAYVWAVSRCARWVPAALPPFAASCRLPFRPPCSRLFGIQWTLPSSLPAGLSSKWVPSYLRRPCFFPCHPCRWPTATTSTMWQSWCAQS